MSKGKIFYIVDVFAEEKYAGNQLAVVRDAAGLSDSEMQNITKEMNYSETTFILSDDRRNGGYDVRIFTPAQEVPFAGHPTLGTAYIIQQEIIKEPIEKIILNLKVGRIPVTFNYTGKEKNVLRMKQIEPTFGQIIEPEPIAEVLSLNTSDIDERFPVQEVSTGMFFIIVPLKTLDAVKRAKVAKEKYLKLIENRQAKAILVFCPETYSQENDLNVRVFVDYYGIPEDPATGSGNGCLAGYLVKHRYFGKDQIDIRAEQGYEIARPSLIYLRAKNKEGKINISVGGKVVTVAKGELI
jgi:trans-2,3-dihydro-3-hydroxyanthranilate isomerase